MQSMRGKLKFLGQFSNEIAQKFPSRLLAKSFNAVSLKSKYYFVSIRDFRLDLWWRDLMDAMEGVMVRELRYRFITAASIKLKSCGN